MMMNKILSDHSLSDHSKQKNTNRLGYVIKLSRLQKQLTRKQLAEN